MNLEYEDRVVCFLDILGFKKIINDSMKNSENLNNIISAIQFLQDYIKEKEEYQDILQESKKITQFSDCIVISFSLKEKSQLFYTLIEIQHIILELIDYGFLVRGGISYGKLIHTENILIGPAMIEAYELESQVANYPRVILTEELIQLSLNAKSDIHTSNDEENYIKECLGQDSDGMYFIDYFISVQYELDDEYMYPKYLMKLYEIITNGLKNKNPNIYVKYMWMKEKYNFVAKQIEQNKNKVNDFELRRMYDEIKILNER